MLESTTTVTNPARGSKPEAKVSAARTSVMVRGRGKEGTRTASEHDAELVADQRRLVGRVPRHVLLL
jgi:hypothetical protein